MKAHTENDDRNVQKSVRKGRDSINVHLPKNKDKTVWFRVEGNPEGPTLTVRLRLRGLGSSGSFSAW